MMVVLAVVITLLLIMVLALYLYLVRQTTLEERTERAPVVHIISTTGTSYAPQPQQSHQSEQRARVFTGKFWPVRVRDQHKLKIPGL